MKVTIKTAINYSDRGYHGFEVYDVEIADACPICGGPRGLPVLRPFMEDGAPYSVHCWQNPCGHVDFYGVVAQEAACLLNMKG